MKIITEYLAHGSTFATIAHDGGTLTLLIPPGMSVADGLLLRSAEYRADAEKATHTANLIIQALEADK